MPYSWISFFTIIIEVQGQWGEDTKRLFKSIIAQTSSHASARAQTSTYWIRKISITLQTFVSYHIRKSLYSVNALLHDAHTFTHTELFTYINATDILIPPFNPHKYMVLALILCLVYLCILYMYCCIFSFIMYECIFSVTVK